MARLTPNPEPASRTRLGRVSQTQWVVVAMIAGVAVGWAFPDRPDATGFRATDLQILSNIFLRLIKSLVAPLLFGTRRIGVTICMSISREWGASAARTSSLFRN